MGKIRRLRQKFHLASSRNSGNNENSSVDSRNEEVTNEPALPVMNFSPNENIFAGIDINVNELRKSLLEDDRVSIRSVAKSCKYDSKGKPLTKAEKRKLRHTLFLQKIDAIQQLARETKKKRKHKLSVKSLTADPVSGKQNVYNKKSCKQIDYETHDRTKIKSIKTAKQRQKMMMNNIAAFRRILQNPKFKSDPCEVISEIVQKKVHEGKL